jgi:hypothetical protein
LKPNKLRWPRRVKTASGSFMDTSPSLCGGRATAASTNVASISVPAFSTSPLASELAVQLGEQRLGEGVLGQRGAEAAQRRLVRRAVVEAAEAAEGQPVGQRLLKTRIGKLVPLRQQQRVEQRQRRIARPARGRAQRREQPLHRRPVDQADDAFQPAVRASTRRQQRLRKAPLSNPPLTHPRLAAARSEQQRISQNLFRQGVSQRSPVAHQWEVFDWRQYERKVSASV